MRFEIVTAYAMGITLPVLEVIRRRSNFEGFAHYIDDFLVGALLLYAARAAMLGKRNGNVLLVTAWAILCGGFYNSFFDQLENSDSQDVSGFSNVLVVVIKGALYLVTIVCLVKSVRSAIAAQSKV